MDMDGKIMSAVNHDHCICGNCMEFPEKEGDKFVSTSDKLVQLACKHVFEKACLEGTRNALKTHNLEVDCPLCDRRITVLRKAEVGVLQISRTFLSTAMIVSGLMLLASITARLFGCCDSK